MRWYAPFILCSIAAVLVGYTNELGYAQVRTSNNFQIQSDSINVGGGFGTSTNFEQESTVGEVATGRSTSTNFTLLAGFQQMQEQFLALSAVADVLMSPDIGGLTGGESDGSTTVVATTDGSAGYQLTIVATGEPAMQSASGTIVDYLPSGIVPDATFSTGASDAHFGFSVAGPDVAASFLVTGGVCGSGASVAQTCWDGLSTTTKTIVSAPGANHPDGATTTLYFRVGIGSFVNQAPGTYTATTTITMLPL